MGTLSMMDALARWLTETAVRVLLMVAALIVLVPVTALIRRGSDRWRTTIGDALVLGSMGLVALVTLVPAPIGEQPDRINLLPFRDLVWAAQGKVDAALAVGGLIGNVILFVPLGVAVAFRGPRTPAARLLLLGFAWSAFVEGGQAVLDIGRLADVTDLIANTGGTALGIWLQRWIASAQAERHTED